jgi:aminoglycoside phosphotransferase (APT) family kinase protein
VLRDSTLAAARTELPVHLAEALAAIHAITPENTPGLVIPTPQSAGERSPVDAALYFCKGMLDALPHPHPAMELTLRWLADHPPPESERVLVHGDFRTGNFMVKPEGLSAVLDWEFAHWGVRACDLAWISVRDWRFGRLKHPVGGFASRSAFYKAYTSFSGWQVDPVEVHWWEIMGNLRWGAGAVFQAERVLSGGEFDLELLAIGRRAAEMEHEMLRLIAHGPTEVY